MSPVVRREPGVFKPKMMVIEGQTDSIIIVAFLGKCSGNLLLSWRLAEEMKSLHGVLSIGKFKETSQGLAIPSPKLRFDMVSDVSLTESRLTF